MGYNSYMWPESEKTKELLADAKDGDDLAINSLMDRHRNALRRLISMRMDRKLQRRIDVSDIVQDVLIEANRRLQDYLTNPVMSFHLWLRHIARDRIIDTHRRHRVSAKRSIDREQPVFSLAHDDKSSVELATQLQDHELTPAAQAMERELGKQIEQAVSELDETDAEIIVMRNYEHLSNQEVAEILKLTEPAASMRYLRAMRRLRSTLVQEPEDRDS